MATNGPNTVNNTGRLTYNEKEKLATFCSNESVDRNFRDNAQKEGVFYKITDNLNTPLPDWEEDSDKGFKFCESKNIAGRLKFQMKLPDHVAAIVLNHNRSSYRLSVYPKDNENDIMTFTMEVDRSTFPQRITKMTVNDIERIKRQEQASMEAKENGELAPASKAFSSASKDDFKDDEPQLSPEKTSETSAFNANNAPINEQPKKKGSPLVPIIIAVVVALLIALGAVFYFFKDAILGGADTTASQEQTAPPKEEVKAPEARACDLNGDDRTVLQSCLASKPSNEDLYILVGQALRAERCDLALRLLSAKGRAPDGGDFAYVLAMYSAPNSTFATNCIPKNAQEAQYWAKRASEAQNFNEGQARQLFDKYIEQK